MDTKENQFKELFEKNKMSEGICYLQVTRGATNRVPFIPKNLPILRFKSSDEFILYSSYFYERLIGDKINLYKESKNYFDIKVCLLNYFNLRIIKYDHCYWTKPRTWLI